MSLAERQPIELGEKRLDWPELLDVALTVPGSLGNTYNRFYEYSFGNQVLLYLQGVYEPVATYKRWQDMGRQVLKGSKAKAILRPVMRKVTDEAGEEQTRVTGFKMVRCLFGVSETEGDELPEVAPKDWSREQALANLDIREVPFTQLNGNIQGYSFERKVAINPVATYPFKTFMHELGHIVLGHTTRDQAVEYAEHRGVKEFQAEATAFLTVRELDATDEMDEAESRAYIQGWLRGDTPPDQAVKQVFAATTKILQAGRADTTTS